MNEDPAANTQNELTRARSAARSMSEQQLIELHGQGSSAFSPGAWQVLDEEIRRRQRIKDRKGALAPPDDEQRYPALRTTVFLLKLIAVIALLASVILVLSSMRESGFAAVLALLGGLLIAISYWAGAELLVLLMDIEENTRSFRGGPR